MKGKKIIAVLLCTASVLLTACGGQQNNAGNTGASGASPDTSQNTSGEAADEESKDTAEAADKSGKRVALVVNQRFGDQSSVDIIASGVDKAAQEFGLEVKKLESTSTASHEDDIRSLAREGYDLIITTFPQMSEATLAVAKEYPDIKFAAIYQYINAEETEAENVWSSEYHGEEYFYVMGALGAYVSQTGHIGYVNAAESPSANASINALMLGALSVNPDIDVSFTYVGSFEDPAAGKEVALSMADGGVDYIVGDAAKTSIGCIEGAKEAGIAISTDTNFDYAYDLYPDGYFASTGLGFDENAYMACKMLAEDSFTGGIMSPLGLKEGIYYIGYDALEKFSANDSKWGNIFKEKDAIAFVKDLEAKIVAGEITVPNDTSYPDFDSLKSKQQ